MEKKVPPQIVRIEERELLGSRGTVRIEYGEGYNTVIMMLMGDVPLEPGYTLEVIIDQQIHNIIVQRVTKHFVPVTGGRLRDKTGLFRTEIKRNDVSHTEIEGIIDHIRPVGDPPPEELEFVDSEDNDFIFVDSEEDPESPTIEEFSEEFEEFRKWMGKQRKSIHSRKIRWRKK
jgi:hypothetical protein